MTGRAARRTATGLMAFTFVMLVVNEVFGVMDRPYVGSDPGDNVYFVVTFLACLIYLVVGRLIVSRQPNNTVGWLLIAIPVVGALALGNGSYATRAFAVPGTSLPLGIWSAWLDRWLLVATLFIFVPIFLFYPDGHLPSPRWRWVAALLFSAMGITTLAFAITPGALTGFMAHLEDVDVRNPLGVGSPGGIVQSVTAIAGAITLVASILACSAIVIRYRRSRDEVRQQIRWLAPIPMTFFALFVIGLVLDWLTHQNATIETVMFTLMFSTLALGIPIACGVAILRYRLYDLDVVVRKAVVFGLLATFIAAVYAVIVAGAGTLIGSRSNPVLSFAAAAVLAIAFQPVRERARHLADRLVYGHRATPYEVLSEFSGRVGEAYATDDVLVRMAEVLAGGTGAASATIWLQVSGDMRPAATWPSGSTSPTAVPDDAVEVNHQGDRLGALSVAMPPSDPMTPARRKLVEDLAAQAGLVLRNVRLIEELRASRQRLVAAQDEERRKLERNIHDGVQQQLVALNVQLGLLAKTSQRDPAKASEMATHLQSRTMEALGDLRDLARGIYPPLLADKGLAAALESQARRSPIPVEIAPDGVGRYTQDVESAVYFCCLEALNNVAKYANASSVRIRLAAEDASLVFEVMDDGDGFDPAATGYGTGLQGMADRLDAIGGSLQVRSQPSHGTEIRGSVPIASRARAVPRSNIPV